VYIGLAFAIFLVLFGCGFLVYRKRIRMNETAPMA
jgi:hypothetical protein